VFFLFSGFFSGTRPKTYSKVVGLGKEVSEPGEGGGVGCCTGSVKGGCAEKDFLPDEDPSQGGREKGNESKWFSGAVTSPFERWAKGKTKGGTKERQEENSQAGGGAKDWKTGVSGLNRLKHRRRSGSSVEDEMKQEKPKVGRKSF